MIRKLTIALAAALLTLSAAAAEHLKISATVDSAVMEMGSRTAVNLSVVVPKGAPAVPVDFPQSGKEYDGVAVVAIDADTAALADGRTRIDYRLTVQPFYPGVATLQAFRFAQGTDTVSSEQLTIKVMEVPLDSLTTINPMTSVQNPPTRWYDYIPDWTIWVVVGLLVLAIACVLYLLYRRNGTILPIARKPEIPPYELAMQQLQKLRGEKLAETGHEKEYYTRLTDILRRYLEGRFGINALEMTSTQILRELRSNEQTRLTHTQMQQILEIADFVKFAKARPLPDDNIKTFNMALDFVETTKPAPEPEEGTPEASNKPK